MSLLSLLENDGSTLKRLAGTNGGEYGGACPWCGGVDRFRVWPEQNGGRYWCRNCGKAGDSIQYLRDKRGLSFADACRQLNITPEKPRHEPHPTQAAWEPKDAPAPPEAWQARARTFLDQAVSALWSREGEPMRAWLTHEKGLQEAITREACLGYNPADIYGPRAAWGLEPLLKDDGTERRQWIPAGLVIPLVMGSAVHRLRIRRDAPGDGPRYVIVSGSGAASLGLGLHEVTTILIVESELDAWLLHKEAGDLAGIVALGSAQAKPDTRTHEALKGAELVLMSLDSDDAGARAAWRFWPETYGAKVRRWPCVKGKDAGDARLAGLDLREWVVSGIFGTFERFERFCIQTIDGGLSDNEALRETMGRGAGPGSGGR